MSPAMSQRTRLVAFAVIVALAIAGVVAYAVLRRAGSTAARPGRASPRALRSLPVEAVPHLVYRSTALGPDYGKVAMSTLSDPGGASAVTEDACDRVDQRQWHHLCLRPNRAWCWPARSPPGTAPVASAYPVSCPAYPAGPGCHPTARSPPPRPSSRVTPTSVPASRRAPTCMTWLPAPRCTSRTSPSATEGRRITPVDRNYWGVTFLDDDTFYLTVAFDGRPWLARGSLSTHTVTTVHADAECPSLSPDGRRVAYKKLQPSGGWRIAVLDLAGGPERLLTETHSVDDQVQWLDDDTVLYGLPLTGERGGESDLWELPADGAGPPRLLVPQAWSASVVR